MLSTKLHSACLRQFFLFGIRSVLSDLRFPTPCATVSIFSMTSTFMDMVNMKYNCASHTTCPCFEVETVTYLGLSCPRSQAPRASFSLWLLRWRQRLVVAYLQLLSNCVTVMAVSFLAVLMCFSELGSEYFVGLLQLRDPLQNNLHNINRPRTAVPLPIRLTHQLRYRVAKLCL